MPESFWICVECVLEKISIGIFWASFILSGVGLAWLLMLLIHPAEAYDLMDCFARFVLNNL